METLDQEEEEFSIAGLKTDFLIAGFKPKSDMEILFIVCTSLMATLFIYLGGRAFQLNANFTTAENNAMLTVIIASGTMIASYQVPKRLALMAEGILIGGMINLVLAILFSMALNEVRFSFFVVTAALTTTLVTGYFRFLRNEN